MTTLIVAAKGRVTLHDDMLKHLGVAPGDRVALAASASPFGEPDFPLQQDPVDATWAQEFV